MVPSKVLCFHSSFFIRTVDHDRNRSMMMNINFDWDWGFAVHSPKHGKVPSSCIYIIYTRRSQLKTIIQIDAKHQPNKTEQTSPKSRADAKLNYKSLFFRVRPVFFPDTTPPVRPTHGWKQAENQFVSMMSPEAAHGPTNNNRFRFDDEQQPVLPTATQHSSFLPCFLNVTNSLLRSCWWLSLVAFRR